MLYLKLPLCKNKTKPRILILGGNCYKSYQLQL